MRIKREAGCVLRFKRKRKITNAKIYEDKRDLYCRRTGSTARRRTATTGSVPPQCC